MKRILENAKPNGEEHRGRDAGRPGERRTNAVPTQALPKLMLLVSVVPRAKADLYLTLIQGFSVNLQLSLAAEGTASGETLRLLGLSDAEKAVIFSVIRQDIAEEALRYLEEKFRTLKNGKGIAFTVPMSSVIGVAVYRFLSNSGKGGVR